VTVTIVFKNAQTFRRGAFVGADVSLSLAGPVSRDTLPRSVDASSLVILPGLVDVHVHLREPGFCYKETIRTGSLAAAHGGYTAVCAMPNLDPVPDCPETLQPELDAIARDAVIRVLPYGAITRGERGQRLADMAAMAPCVAAFSDDGHGVQSDDMMRAAMAEAKRLGKLIVAHCEDNALLRGGYIHDGAYARAHGHRGICSESEWGQIKRDLELVRETGCGYHVCHISTKESVALIRQAKAEGLDVSCETGPHYLLLDDSCLQEDGRFKMNPPLRDRTDREALLEGLADGTIDMIATDHAPHSAEEKSRGLEKSAMGVVGLETAFPLLYTYLVKPGVISFPRLMELLHDAPCRRFGIPEDTGVTVFDLDDAYPVDPESFLSKGRATPFAGWQVRGRCLLTAADGRLAWWDEERLNGRAIR
jgi:dihydroorotase